MGSHTPFYIHNLGHWNFLFNFSSSLSRGLLILSNFKNSSISLVFSAVSFQFLILDLTAISFGWKLEPFFLIVSSFFHTNT